MGALGNINARTMEKTPQESKEGATKGSAGTDVARSKKSKQKRAPQADVKLPAWRQATLNGLPWVCFAAVSSLVALRTVKGGPLAEIAQRCTTLAYPTTDADGARKFERGMDDAWLVAFLMCMLITLRGLLQNVVFHPMAKAMGVTKREQPSAAAACAYAAHTGGGRRSCVYGSR